MHRRLLALLVLAASALAWIGADVARVVHEATVVHVVCVHGEVTEVTTDDEDVDDDTPADFHTHGCAFQALANPGSADPPPALPEPTVEAEHGVAALVRAQHGARPPPLAFAPKTSPPAAA